MEDQLIDIAVNDLSKSLQSNSLSEQSIRRAFVSAIVPIIVHESFRNNNPIEDIHSGKYYEIPEEASRISNAEMKIIMQAAVNNLANILDKIISNPEICFSLVQSSNRIGWDKPNWEEIDSNNKKIQDLLTQLLK